MQYISLFLLDASRFRRLIEIISYGYFQVVIRQYKILRWHVFTYTLRLYLKIEMRLIMQKA